LKVSQTSRDVLEAFAKLWLRSGKPRCWLFAAGSSAGQLAAMKLFQAK
jgi:hypothetical protein